MALNITGHTAQARKAWSWLFEQQNDDGSWFSNYLTLDPEQPLNKFKKESNFIAYPATGAWHDYLVTREKQQAERSFPYIEKAIDLVVSWQSEEGDILWAKSEREQLAKDALITGCASTLRSLECAINLANLLNVEKSHWSEAHKQLAYTLKNKPWRFDRTWESKQRFSMDWFYPVLSGAYSESEARTKIESRWEEFYKSDLGCRCVNDHPWITIAESCELTMALIAAGEKETALKLYNNLARWQDTDGGYWTGYVYEDDAIWPEEKTSWTAAACILAADALFQITPASTLFTTPAYVG